MKKGGGVYIMTNATNTTYYTGVTSDLKGRVYKHKTDFYPNSFTARYKLHKLVYYYGYMTITEAIYNEKKIKAGSRKKKIALIEGMNPEWRDLFDDL
jgi:putative endonuclease